KLPEGRPSRELTQRLLSPAVPSGTREVFLAVSSLDFLRNFEPLIHVDFVSVNRPQRSFVIAHEDDGWFVADRFHQDGRPATNTEGFETVLRRKAWYYWLTLDSSDFKQASIAAFVGQFGNNYLLPAESGDLSDEIQA